MSRDEGRPPIVIGAGPAGLAAAEMLARAGLAPLVLEAKPSPARKFLMAGKSGLNLTRDEPPARFAATYDRAPIARAVRDFGPAAVRVWADDLGAEVFTGTSGRVFPAAMKASPLLRRWLERLDGLGAELRTRWRWTGLQRDGAGPPRFTFQTPDGPRVLCPPVSVLALGGGSWPRLGSDAAWVPVLREAGVPVADFRPANMGFDVDWSEHFAGRFAGHPVKPAALRVGELRVKGEFVITRGGIEGSAVYAVSAALRDRLAAGGAGLTVDLLPDLAVDEVTRRLARPRGKASWATHLRRTLRLDGVRAGMLREPGPLPEDPAELARRIKVLAIPVTRPRPLDEAISSAGGIRWEGVGADLMLTALPGVFAAGEMLDWEAPTGGYLLTGCLATGRQAGTAAARWLAGPGM